MNITYIIDDSARRRSFKKRMKGIKKKLDELTTLCAVDACAIVYSSYEPQPEVWPNYVTVQQMLAEFMRMPPKDQFRKMVNQDSYVRERIKKTDEELKKKIKENREKEMTALMHQCLAGNVDLDNLSPENLNDLGPLIDQKLSKIDNRLESLSKEVPEDPAPPMAPAGGVPEGHGNSLETETMVDILESTIEMRSPKSYMDLLMDSD